MTDLPDEVIEANRHRAPDDYLLPPSIVAIALGISEEDMRALIQSGCIEGEAISVTWMRAKELWPARRSIEKATGSELPLWVLPEGTMSERIKSLPLHLQFAYHQAIAGEWEADDEDSDDDHG